MKPLYSCPPEPLQICPKSKFFLLTEGGDTIDFRVDGSPDWANCFCHAGPDKRKVMCCVAEVEWTERAERLRTVESWMLEKHKDDWVDTKWYVLCIKFGYKAADAEYQAERWRKAGNA